MLHDYLQYTISLDVTPNVLADFLTFLSQVGCKVLTFSTSLCPIEDNRWIRIFSFVPEEDEVDLSSILMEQNYTYFGQPPLERPTLPTSHLDAPGSITAFLAHMAENEIGIRSMETAYPELNIWRMGLGFHQSKYAEDTRLLLENEGYYDLRIVDEVEERRAPSLAVGYVIYVSTDRELEAVTRSLKNYRNAQTRNLGVFIYHIAVTHYKNLHRMRLLTYVPFSNPQTSKDLTENALQNAGIAYDNHYIVRTVLPRSMGAVAKIVKLLHRNRIRAQAIQNLPRHYLENGDALTLFSVNPEQRDNLLDILP